MRKIDEVHIMVKYVYFYIHEEHTFFYIFHSFLSSPPTTKGAKHND